MRSFKGFWRNGLAVCALPLSSVAAQAQSLPSLPASTLPHDLSPLGMFMAADIVVKAVMVGLALASILSWTVLVVKLIQIAGATARARRGVQQLNTAASLASAAEQGRLRGAAAEMVEMAAGEVTLSADLTRTAGRSGLSERVSSLLGGTQARASRRIARGTGILATIGSTAPFVGLFGTVWGIMNSFIGISQAQTTNLAVVAPGIAEALLATAMGLVAAIPAVIFYNLFARQITGYRLNLSEVGASIERLVSRDLDRRIAQGG